jgi:O-antigen/teichoic acid export membrane protein
MGSRAETKIADDEASPFFRGRLFHGMLLLAGGEMAAKLFCFLAFARLGRVLGPERYGSLEFVLAVIVFFTLPADCGLGSYGAREIARGRWSLPRLLAGVMTLRMSMAALSVGLLLAILPALPAQSRTLLAIYGAGLLIVPLQFSWLFQGLGKMQWVAAGSVIRYGVFAGLIFLCLGTDISLIWIGIIECLSILISGLVCLWVARQDLKGTLAEWPPQSADLAGHMGSALPIGLSQVSWAVLWYFATVFLGIWVAGESLGQFAAALRIVMAIHTFVWMYFYNLLPAISRTAAASAKGLQPLLGPSLALTSWAGGLGALLVSILADEIMALIFGEAYRPGGRLLAVLIWAVPLALVNGHYRYALIACDHERLELRCNAIGAAVAASLGVLLIPARGALSGAVVLLVSALVVSVLAYAAAREARLSVPSIARILPASSAIVVAGLVANGVSTYGPWMAAAVAAAAYLSVLAIYEFRGPLGWRVRPVRSKVPMPLDALPVVERTLDFQGPISA